MSRSSNRAVSGKEDFDLVFGESEGAAYEREVEIHGDDLGAAWVAAKPAVSTASPSSSWSNTPSNPSPPVSTLPLRSLTPTELAQPTSNVVMPNFAALRAAMNAPYSSYTSVLSPQMLSNPTPASQPNQHRRRRHHHGQGQGQGHFY